MPIFPSYHSAAQLDNNALKKNNYYKHFHEQGTHVLMGEKLKVVWAKLCHFVVAGHRH
jgi:hypothetical protein